MASNQQVLAAADAGEADSTQAAMENLQLVAGRRDTWDRQQAQTAFELSDRIEQLRNKVSVAAAAAAKSMSKTGLLPPAYSLVLISQHSLPSKSTRVAKRVLRKRVMSPQLSLVRMQVAEAQARMDTGAAVRPEDKLVVERHLSAEARARLDELKRQRQKQVKHQGKTQFRSVCRTDPDIGSHSVPPWWCGG